MQPHSAAILVFGPRGAASYVYKKTGVPCKHAEQVWRSQTMKTPVDQHL